MPSETQMIEADQDPRSSAPQETYDQGELAGLSCLIVAIAQSAPLGDNSLSHLFRLRVFMQLRHRR